MHEILKRNLFFVKEHVGLFKAANNFDVLNPQTGEIIMMCREERMGLFTKLLRFSDYKRMTRFDIQVRDPQGRQVVRLTRGVSLFLSRVRVFDENDQMVGGFKQKLFSIGGSFDVLDADSRILCSLKGKWTGWNFKFVADGMEFASVSKKWSGIGRELFTSADNYILEIADVVEPDNPVRILILAAVMCIDMVLKE